MKFAIFSRNNDWTIFYIFFLIIFIIVIVFPMFLNTGMKAGKLAYRISCTSNLKQIGLALKQYTMDYEGNFPHKYGWNGLDMLRALDYLAACEPYRCPSTSASRDNSGALCKENVSYVYLGGLSECNFSEKEQATIPLAFDIPSNHTRHYREPSNRNYYINVLFMNGHVKYYNIKVKTSREVIEELDSMFNYSPQHLKLLYEKADTADRMYKLK